MKPWLLGCSELVMNIAEYDTIPVMKNVKNSMVVKMWAFNWVSIG